MLREGVSDCSEVTSVLERDIDHITRYLSRPYFRSALIKLSKDNPDNARLICDYILDEQTEINLKPSTMEGKIKVLVWLSNFHPGKNFVEMTKQDLLQYLNNLRKPVSEDPTQRWIGSYNGRQAVFLKFFKWLYYRSEPDYRKRTIPESMQGIKKLNRKEKTPYKSSDIWNAKEHSLFLKFCPSKRDRCYHAMAVDMSARPSEILNIKINDIKFCVTEDNKQYAEVRIIDGKTGPRTVPLIDSIPYVKEWITEHPHGSNQDAWLFISQSTTSKYTKFTYEGLSTKYEYYKKKFFPSLLNSKNVSDPDKAFIRNLLLKPWNLYVLRHSALTEKSQYLPEAILRSHAGWSMSSKMPQIYLHLSGESSKILLQRRGIIKKEDVDVSALLTSKQCPNCNEANKRHSRFCVKCGLVLSYDSYNEVRNEDKQKIDSLENDIKLLKSGMDKLFLIIHDNPILINVKPEILKETIAKNMET
ncbi:tyrosine-type recombinase/integrase [Candidatus Nitrosocosmicus hydrocola]|uniref:tyrosine-type recombinase/integrase n=1 Tax=Candidatus Nitrosocosmicus hydrocola TaxID=1826872 RepID=UPI0011E5EFB7|nr:tyrosine-type recombinase/integrase [Candidatus Nitrosocosmicus hydrocola]